MTTLLSSASPIWFRSAWTLFLSQRWLWMLAALPCVLISAVVVFMVTGRVSSMLHIALSTARVSPGIQGQLVLLVTLALLLSMLLTNTAMTSMANKAVRGKELGFHDLFQYQGFGVTTLALTFTLLAVVLGSLVFFVGAFVATGILLGCQSSALRTGSLLEAFNASASVLRASPVRTLGLAAALLLLTALGFVSGGLAFFAVFPVAKIIGAMTDAQTDFYSTQNQSAADFTVPGGLVPPAAQFHWTAAEEEMLRQTTPPPQPVHVVGALLVAAVAIFLLYPRFPSASAALPAAQSPEIPTVSAPSSDPVSSLSPAPSAAVATAESVFVDGYGSENDPPLPVQMHWGSDIVRIEKVAIDGDAAAMQTQLTVLDAEGSAIYTVSNDNIMSVKREPLLGGDTLELLIVTEAGGDGTSTMELALTQKGGVHDLFLLRDEYGVTPQREEGSPLEEIVVDAPLDGPMLALHHYPVLTSTYRWDGNEYQNVTQSSPAATLARVKQCEQSLLGPATDQDNAIQDTATLMINARILGVSDLPVAVTSSPNYQLGMAWLVENKSNWDSIVQEAAATPQVLPRVTGNEISGENGQ